MRFVCLVTTSLRRRGEGGEKVRIISGGIPGVDGCGYVLNVECSNRSNVILAALFHSATSHPEIRPHNSNISSPMECLPIVQSLQNLDG
jgi:hypothetical protein